MSEREADQEYFRFEQVFVSLPICVPHALSSAQSVLHRDQIFYMLRQTDGIRQEKGGCS